MFMKKLVLVFGLLGGMSSSLNVIRPEHQARMQEIGK